MILSVPALIARTTTERREGKQAVGDRSPGGPEIAQTSKLNLICTTLGTASHITQQEPQITTRPNAQKT